MGSNFNDKIRSKCVSKIDTIMDDLTTSRNIEKGIFNFIIDFSKENNINRKWENKIFYNLYFSKIRSIVLNLNKESYIKNDYLLKNIKDGTIKAEDVSNLSVYDIYPENWKKMIDDKTKRDKLKYELKPEAMTERYKCRKCGSRKCSYYELQTRSADEPMTQFFTCLDCQNRWKM
tara:strand:- start:524 stop:1048 length:525 start_codon:yes stop_codon:yes gene_type:complete